MHKPIALVAILSRQLRAIAVTARRADWSRRRNPPLSRHLRIMYYPAPHVELSSRVRSAGCLLFAVNLLTRRRALLDDDRASNPEWRITPSAQSGCRRSSGMADYAFLYGSGSKPEPVECTEDHLRLPVVQCDSIIPNSHYLHRLLGCEGRLDDLQCTKLTAVWCRQTPTASPRTQA
jgi:hypothetical protein